MRTILKQHQSKTTIVSNTSQQHKIVSKSRLIDVLKYVKKHDCKVVEFVNCPVFKFQKVTSSYDAITPYMITYRISSTSLMINVSTKNITLLQIAAV